MRYSPEHKQQTRQKILEAAGRLFREKGYNGVGVDAIMAEVGLTAGGFYAHFSSKEALFVEAVATALKTRANSLSSNFQGQDESVWLHTLINSYLSRSHRDLQAEGCPFPALTPDIARSDPKTRARYEKYLLAFMTQIENRLPEDSIPKEERSAALAALMIGGLMMSRAVNDSEFSNRILKACRQTAKRICEQSTENSPTTPNESQ